MDLTETLSYCDLFHAIVRAGKWAISLIVCAGNVQGERGVRLALFADRAGNVLANVGGRARFYTQLERFVTVGTEEVPAARFGDRFSVLQPRHCVTETIASITSHPPSIPISGGILTELGIN